MTPRPLLYIATSNQGKLRDFASAAVIFGMHIEPLPGLANIKPPHEDAPTFEGNAREKAIYYSLFKRDAIVLADDSGLAVDALGGAPGVRSARYAADAGIGHAEGIEMDTLNNQHLLMELASVPKNKRVAHYICALAAACNGSVLAVAEGTVAGLILESPRGEGGFGYDPLFYLPEQGLTMAEIDIATRQRLSHRGRALSQLLALQPSLLRSSSFTSREDGLPLP